MPKVPDLTHLARDPEKLFRFLWPQDTYYPKQWSVVESVWFNKTTVVPAGNKLGKDFIAGRIIVAFFLSRRPCRVVTTSATDDHLVVLWGEMKSAIADAAAPLLQPDGGPLILKHREIEILRDGRKCPKSYIKGMVATPDTIAAMQGHHIAPTGDGIPRTLFAVDEASSVPDQYHEKAYTWYDRGLIIGNTWPCQNFFFHMVEGQPGGMPGGDIPREDGEPGYLRKVIHITATDSPNVRFALAEKRRGKKPSNRILVPGVKPWDLYRDELKMLDPHQRSVIHDAKFYKGAEILMFPDDRLKASAAFYQHLRREGTRLKSKAAGIDPGEGGDNSAMVAGEERGVTAWKGYKTPNTNQLYLDTKEFVAVNRVPWDMVFIDRGGGGKQLGDRLVAEGYPVRLVSFGAPPTPPVRPPGSVGVDLRSTDQDNRLAYKSRRSQMYGIMMNVFDTDGSHASEYGGFGVPPSFAARVFPQLSPIPKVRDSEGVLTLLPKNRTPLTPKNQKTLVELIGHSPDEADALALMLYGLFGADPVVTAGAISYDDETEAAVLTSQRARDQFGDKHPTGDLDVGAMYDPFEGMFDHE